VARACTLAPDSVDDATLPTRVSAAELVRHKEDFWALTEQGALSYRSNRYKEAIPFLEQSLQVEPRPGAAVLNWLWLAMTYQKMGDNGKSREWFNKADKWLGSLGNKMPPPAEADKLSLHLHNWLEAHVLQREAEMLLSSAAEK
jgi:tetratricopeptide (TPR) repeat protein